MDIAMLTNALGVEAKVYLNAFNPVLATPPPSDSSPLVFAGVLASLVVIYLASTIGGEICARLNLTPVLGQLLGGLVLGISAFHLLVFPEGGSDGSNSLIMAFLKATAGLSVDAAATTFQTNSEVISILSEIGVVILLFEIGLESDLQELLRVGWQAAIIAVVGVVVPFVGGTLGLMYLFGVPSIPRVSASQMLLTSGFRGIIMLG